MTPELRLDLIDEIRRWMDRYPTATIEEAEAEFDEILTCDEYNYLVMGG